VLVAVGFEHRILKGSIYFATAFSICVKILNINTRRENASQHQCDLSSKLKIDVIFFGLNLGIANQRNTFKAHPWNGF
jgi:hypothetical protein